MRKALERCRVLLRRCNLAVAVFFCGFNHRRFGEIVPGDNQNGIDLVLLDLNMRDVDGFRVLQEMKKDYGLRSIPVVIVSAEDFERAQETIGKFQAELQSGHNLADMSDAEGDVALGCATVADACKP